MRTGHCVIHRSLLPAQLRGLALWAAAAAAFMVIWMNLATLSVQAQAFPTDTGGKTSTAFPLAGFHHPLVEVLLYNPPLDELSGKYPYKAETVTKKLEPTLVLTGNGVEDGSYTLRYEIEGVKESLCQGTTDVSVTMGLFESIVTLPNKYPQATRVVYELTPKNQGASLKGSAGLRWTRFRGRVKYLDGGWRSTYICLRPNGYASGINFYVPVGDDGSFDARLPARVYSVINVNGTGYGYDAMERWAWDYDLTRDRDDEFTIGRTELYGIHAFNIKGGASTVFVTFRPTALSRLLQFDADGDGLLSAEERKPMGQAMKRSPTVIGPVLKAEDVRVWLNGKEQKIAQFDMIPENNGDTWQVLYLLQFYPDTRVAHRVWHEIKLEVRSKETLTGKEIIDFGQGSVGFYRQ